MHIHLAAVATSPELWGKCARVIAATLLLASLRPGGALAYEEVRYAVARESWDEGLGNHRAVVHVERKTDTVVVKIPWRRRDRDPERKQILIVDAAGGSRITNVARLHLDRFQGVLAFQPHTAPGDYYVYYLPFQPKPGWGNYTLDYLRPQDTAEPGWKARLPADTDALPQAQVLRMEARTAFDSFYPMEVVATPEETQALLQRSVERRSAGPNRATLGAPSYLLFPEDRRFPIRMADDLPLRWVKSGTSKAFRGEAQRNEFYVFQIGIWAAETNLAGLDVEFTGEIARWLNCFNTGGTNWDGRPFHKTVNVPQGRVQALWIGVDVPRNARAGQHQARVTIRPANAPPADVALNLTVLPTELGDRGDSEPSRLTRLRWLDSGLGADTEPTAPYRPLVRDGQTVLSAGLRITFDPSHLSALPSELTCGEAQLLRRPIALSVAGIGDARVRHDAPELQAWSPVSNGRVEIAGTRTLRTLKIGSTAAVEFDGAILLAIQLHAAEEFQTPDLRLEIPLRREIGAYFMGIGLPACHTPTNYTWHWTGPYNSFWIGNAHAGLHVKLLGSTYEGPMQNLYHPKPPPTWFNEGKGGVAITSDPGGEALVQVFTGPFALKAGEERAFKLALLATPVKPLDPATHFRERYWHSTAPPPPQANIINVHHATLPNPFINYPFLAVDKLREVCRTNQAAGRKVKIYYTIRELTTHLPELWALRSLGDEVLAGGPGGGYPWLREHLGTGYTPAWYTVIEGGAVDAAILTSGSSRWYNFYVEGINWLARNIPIDGLYLDDVSYDRTILRRVRKVLDRARPGCRIDLHSNTLFSIGPANQYTEFFPYVDRLWFGEGFKYDQMTPEQWLVESSGIPFGLMGDMLQDGGNRWRGMVFGMTVRAPWAEPQPRNVWQLWDEFGIGEAQMVGWWEGHCPVRTGREDVLATAYVKPGRTLVALASWAPAKAEVKLQVDWKALGLDSGKARLVAPEIKDYQPAKVWQPDEPIVVDPARGWLIYVVE